MKGPRMTAQFDSQDPRDPSQQSSHEYENYVPEREFVLMPFFRRIGRRLGFGGNPAEQSTYAEPPEEATSELPPVEQADLPPAPVAQQEVEAEIAPAVVTFHSGAASASEDKDAAYPISTVDPAQTPAHGIVSSIELAAEKISGTLSGSAQWLQRRREQVLHAIKPREIPAEDLVQVPQKEPIQFPHSESPAWNEERQLAAETPRSATPTAEEADAQLTVPALQRELAWDEPSSEPQHVAMAPQQTSAAPEPVSPPVATWWQHRIDWSKYLTSKRVALIGGLAMAALMIIGISLARRPAADILPQQTATRPLEPGGVTLSTHPVVTRARTQRQGVPAASRTHTHKPHALADDDGPEVVTHYYNQKPSPVHQATVNGVRHYSDLN